MNYYTILQGPKQLNQNLPQNSFNQNLPFNQNKTHLSHFFFQIYFSEQLVTIPEYKCLDHLEYATKASG